MKKTKSEDTPIKDVVIHVLRYDIWLKILTVVSIGLIITGFVVPPTGVIDGSVLIATGELAGLGALFEAGHAIDKGLDVKVKLKNTELEIENDKLEQDIIKHEINTIDEE